MHNYEKPIVSFLNELWNDKSSRKSDEIYSLFSPNLIINSPIGKTIGVNKFHNLNDDWNYAFPNMEVSNIELESFGNVVIANWQSKATHENQFKDIMATGKTVFYPGQTMFYFDHRTVVRYSCTIDMLDLYKQLGMFLKQEEYSEQAIAFKNKALLIKKLKASSTHPLTSREIECLSLNLLGFSSKQVGMILCISYRTDETHLQKALHELQFCSKLQCLESMVEKKQLTLWHDLGKLLMSDHENTKKNLFSS